MKISFPAMAEDQSGWALWIGGGSSVTYTPRRWYRRLIYRVLMYAHDRTEDLWHWLYRVSRRFEPERKMEYVEPKLYGYVGRDGVLRSAPPDNAQPARDSEIAQLEWRVMEAAIAARKRERSFEEIGCASSADELAQAVDALIAAREKQSDS